MPNPENGLPSSVQTEVTVLGAMLLDAVAITDATAKLVADDFSLDSHRRVYRVMTDLLALGLSLIHIWLDLHCHLR